MCIKITNSDDTLEIAFHSDLAIILHWFLFFWGQWNGHISLKLGKQQKDLHCQYLNTKYFWFQTSAWIIPSVPTLYITLE